MWCNIRGSSLTLVSRHQASYVLAHVRGDTDDTVPGFGVHRIGRDNVASMAVVGTGFRAYYVKVKADARIMPAVVRRAMSAMYSMVDGYDFTDFSGCRYLRREFGVDRQAVAHCGNVNAPTPGEFERAKVTAEHHTHYRPEEVWEVAQHYGHKMGCMKLVLKNLRTISGVTEATVSTFLMYILFVRPQVAYIIACSRVLWAGGDIAGLAERLKKLSTPLKSMHNPELLDLTEMFELMCLVNRGIGHVDWDAEKEDRVHPDEIDVPEQRVYDEAKKVFCEGVTRGYRYSTMDWDKYMDARWEWVPSGSVHSQHKEDAPMIKKEYRHRTKFVTLNMMKREHIARFLRRKPEIHAWASVKYEWAKQRAIYGVDLTGSVLTNFAMFRCEEVFKHRFPIGEEAAAERVHKRLKYLLQDAESLCYDFDNFNAQHSKRSMKAVLKAYYDTFYTSMDPAQKQAMEWVIESMDSVTIHNNEGGRNEVFKTNGTLLSGWRLTTFMNTALNYIYFKIAGVFDLPGVIDSVHNGDDVLVAIKDIHTANMVHEKMRSINARAQHTKCNVFSVGEFLRVEHKVDKEKGLGAQYLTRGVATLVHSRIESQEPTRLIEALKAAVTRVEEVAMRSKSGVEVCFTLLNLAVARLARTFEVDINTCKRLIRAHVIVGGPIAGEEGHIDWKYEEKVYYEDDSMLSDEVRRKIARVSDLGPGIYDYANLLTRQFGQYVDREHIVRAITNATQRQLAVTRRTWLTETDVRHEGRYAYGRALFRMYRDVVNIPHLEKGRFVGISPISMLDSTSTQLVKSLIAHVTDVDYTLRVLL